MIHRSLLMASAIAAIDAAAAASRNMLPHDAIHDEAPKAASSAAYVAALDAANAKRARKLARNRKEINRG